ncbi:MAG: hypothetical protein M1813_001573 [Trichoglossum hirsutum]|nr:MAG: hypothetical protein M1813_001573 [Trichoglossum hirsutum]
MSSPASPAATSQASLEAAPLDFERCSELHNQIAALHTASPFLHPQCRLQRDFFVVYANTESVESTRERLSPDIIPYLSAIDIFITVDEVETRGSQDDEDAEGGHPRKRTRLNRPAASPSFTPALHFPHPSLLFKYEEYPVNDANDEQVLESTVVLLYAGVEDEGGLFFDMSANLCCWAAVDSPTWPQRPAEWIPLEWALARYLQCWELGKYVMSAHEYEPEGCEFAMPWAESDLTETLREWEALLRSIEGRLPRVGPEGEDRVEQGREGVESLVLTEGVVLDPTTDSKLLAAVDLQDNTILRRLSLMPPSEEDAEWEDLRSNLTPSFALEFLSQARSPRIPGLRVAPGVGCFSMELMRASLLTDGERQREIFRQRANMRWFERPILLFPYVEGDGKVSNWREWQLPGFGDMLFDRRPGLYLYPELYRGHPDAVKFLSARPVTASEDDFSADANQDDPGEGSDTGSDAHTNSALGGEAETISSGDSNNEQAPEADSGAGEDRPVGSHYGNDVLFSHINFFNCPYFKDHQPRLVSVLRSWRKLVESGVVDVGPGGVEGTVEDAWEKARSTKIGLREFDLGRCW